MSRKTKKAERRPYRGTCNELEKLRQAPDYEEAVNAFFDRLDRISRAHTLYGRRKGHR